MYHNHVYARAWRYLRDAQAYKSPFFSHLSIGGKGIIATISTTAGGDYVESMMFPWLEMETSERNPIIATIAFAHNHTNTPMPEQIEGCRNMSDEECGRAWRFLRDAQLIASHMAAGTVTCGLTCGDEGIKAYIYNIRITDASVVKSDLEDETCFSWDQIEKHEENVIAAHLKKFK